MRPPATSWKKPAFFIGSAAVHAKPLKGFGGAGVLEIVEDDDGGTFRAVYTVRFSGAVYVLHVFQKKSTRGRATAPQDMETVRRRPREAEEHHAEHIARD